jgi:hypothetical protein
MLSLPRSSPASRLTLACLSLALLASGCQKAGDPVQQAAAAAEAAGVEAPSLAEVKAIAEEAFIYGLPLVMSYAANYEFWFDQASSQYKGPPGQLHNERRVFTDKDTAVVTPNSDTPYSFAFVDLRAEPTVVSVPEVEKERYYSVMLCDLNTFNFGYIGSRATGNGAGDYLIAGPEWQGTTPPGIKGVFRSTTQFTVALFRTQLFGPDDLPKVGRIQDAYQVRPLSAFLGQPAPPAAPPLEWPKANAELVKTQFFQYLDFVLALAPAGPEEKAIREKLAKIGLGPGKSFAFQDLSAAHKAALLLGMKEGEKKVEEKVATLGKRINGWQIGAAFGDRDFFNGDWLLRAASAKAGIYGNDAVEAMYPMTRWLPNGELLDASKHNYTLTFPAGQFPPVNSFWSVTMYDGQSQLLIANPLNRFLINSPMLPGMKTNPDGSLTLYIQKDSPGPEKEANWLPAPNGPIYLVMRLYWPKTEAPSILPPGEGAWAPPPVTRVD